MPDRIAEVCRETRETQIECTLNLDGTGTARIDTPVPFMNHMLELFAKHSLCDLSAKPRPSREGRGVESF